MRNENETRLETQKTQRGRSDVNSKTVSPMTEVDRRIQGLLKFAVPWTLAGAIELKKYRTHISSAHLLVNTRAGWPEDCEEDALRVRLLNFNCCDTLTRRGVGEHKRY